MVILSKADTKKPNVSIPGTLTMIQLLPILPFMPIGFCLTVMLIKQVMTIMTGVMLYKNYVLIINIAADIPSSVETKAITASKNALIELEKNTKLLLADRS